MEIIVSGAKFHDFEAAPEYVGTYLGTTMVREKDDPIDTNKKAGDIMGYHFENEEGEVTIIGSSHQINKAVEVIQKGDRLYIHFLEKITNSKGLPVNRFEVGRLAPGENPMIKA